jgi:Ca2+-binding EF-hand superfamily protein
MKLLKSAFIALALALSLGSFSTTALACEDGRTCFGPEQAIDITLGHIAQAMKAINDGKPADEVQKIIKQANDSQKEINANDLVSRHRQKANGHLKKARKAAKKDDLIKATEWLEKGEKGFEGLKKLL